MKGLTTGSGLASLDPLCGLDVSGASVREYIWLPEAEIAPTMASRAQIDRPITTVDGISGGSPTLYYVHTDHLLRPVKMSDASKAFVWQAEYQPWGAVQSLSGTLSLDLRFPGQWFQLEAGLHYNWHRHYEPSLGRYTQADPLGFVDGPSVYGYARNAPDSNMDPDGLQSGGPYHPPTGVGFKCTKYDTCASARAKKWLLRRMIYSHSCWDWRNPNSRGDGRHACEISELWRAYAKCEQVEKEKCKNCPPAPYTYPPLVPIPKPRLPSTGGGANCSTCLAPVF